MQSFVPLSIALRAQEEANAPQPTAPGFEPAGGNASWLETLELLEAVMVVGRTGSDDYLGLDNVVAERDAVLGTYVVKEGIVTSDDPLDSIRHGNLDGVPAV